MRWSCLALTLFAAVSLAAPTHAGRAGHADKSSSAVPAAINVGVSGWVFGSWPHPSNGWPAQNRSPASAFVKTVADAVVYTLIERMLDANAAETIAVTKGATVRLVLHSETETELHLHGYDLAGVAGPEGPAVFTFRATRTGRFAVVAHDDHSLLGRKEVAVAYVEVRTE